MVKSKCKCKLTSNTSNFTSTWGISIVKMAYKSIHIMSKSFSTKEKLQQKFIFSKSDWAVCIWYITREVEMVKNNAWSNKENVSNMIVTWFVLNKVCQINKGYLLGWMERRIWKTMFYMKSRIKNGLNIDGDIIATMMFCRKE